MQVNKLFKLIPFSQPQFPLEIEVAFLRSHESIDLTYTLTGDVNHIHFHTWPNEQNRIKGLWKHTCFEFFICDSQKNYYEFNFSSDNKWNCFYFDAKKDRTIVEYLPLNFIQTNFQNNQLKIQIPFKVLSWPQGFDFTINLSAVIEWQNQILDYFALKHCDTRPNFHHLSSYTPI